MRIGFDVYRTLTNGDDEALPGRVLTLQTLKNANVEIVTISGGERFNKYYDNRPALPPELVQLTDESLWSITSGDKAYIARNRRLDAYVDDTLKELKPVAPGTLEAVWLVTRDEDITIAPEHITVARDWVEVNAALTRLTGIEI
jgi:hypothetical protein